MTDQWEYLSVSDLPVSGRFFKDAADKYGAEGWELVAVIEHRFFIFKRRLNNG